MAETRTFYRDIKPYEVPTRLQDLRGPAHGTVKLPLNVYWGPDPEADLDSLAGITKAYQATLREGRTEDLEQLVNAERLTEVWDELLLPVRVRALWESHFPELAAA